MIVYFLSSFLPDQARMYAPASCLLALGMLASLVLVGPGCGMRALNPDDDDDSSVVGDDDDSTPPPWEADDDDDSGAGDDDDEGPVDDDDDGLGDDDVTPIPVDAITFDLPSLVATPGPSGAVGLAATFQFHYWTELQMEDLFCTQEITIEGVGTFGSAAVAEGCATCSGLLEFDDATRMDVSNPTFDATHCDVDVLNAALMNIGDALLRRVTDGGFGDFLSLALLDSDAMAAAGLDATVSSASAATAQALETEFASAGLDFTHLGFVDSQPGTLAEQSGLSLVASPAVAGSSWHAYWRFFRDPTTNGNGNADMSGTYQAGPFWQINFE